MLIGEVKHDQPIAGMTNSTIVKIQDFSKNYSYLLPEEIMSIPWTLVQVIVYPVAFLRKIDDVLREDYFTFISDYIKHDVPFLKLFIDMIDTYYYEINVDIDLDNEFNNGCASHFKCIRAVHCFVSRSIRCMYMSFLKLVMAKVNLMAWVAL